MNSRRGFTLIETLVALILVTSVALPASLWFYRSRMNQAAMERFKAVQLLESKMNRALLGRLEKHYQESISLGGIKQLEIRHKRDGDEHYLFGRVIHSSGKEVATMEAVWFERGQP
jgi:prepilin-type N-terminal cleavage/methylation domain-containing protein